MANTLPPEPNLYHLHNHPRRAVDLRIPAIEKYAYCLCLHVKPTTIFIAVFKLIRALLFASIILNTEFALNDQAQDIGMSTLDERYKTNVVAMPILTRIIMASVSAVGIYAVVSGRAALLMPFYAMLLVDFFFSLPAFYTRDLDTTFEDGLAYHHRGQHPSTHPNFPRYMIIMSSLISMLLKVYFLYVVWKCYRYLRLIELVTPIRLSEIYPHLPPTGSQYPIVRVLGSIDSTDLSTGHNATPPPYESVASNTKPPNYEEAIKSSGTVFTVSPSHMSSIGNATDSPAYQNHQQQQPHLATTQPTHQAQQTVVFTVPTSEQYQNVSTQVVGAHMPAVDNVRPSSGNTTHANVSNSTGMNMNESNDNDASRETQPVKTTTVSSNNESNDTK